MNTNPIEKENEEDEEYNEKHEDIIRKTEHNIKAHNFNAFKDLNSSSRRHHIYYQTAQSALASESIQSELNQFHLKFKSNNQLKLNNYKDSLEKKILLLKKKIAISYKQTSSFSIQPFQLSNFNYLLRKNTSICLKLLEFITPNDLYHLLRIKEFHQMILSSIKTAIDKRFKLQYETKCAELFDSNDFILCIKHYKKNKKMNSRLFINVKSLLSDFSKKKQNQNNYLNKTVYIKYVINYFSKHNKITNVFAFDVFPRGSSNNYWIFKEYTPFHYDDYEKAYYSNLIGFNQGDTMKVSINIFSENGFVNLDTVHWSRPIIKPTLSTNWLMSSISLTKEDNLFPLRYCEIEELKNEWRDISQMDNSCSFVKSIEIKFNAEFSIVNIFYDDVGYYLFKISLIAKRIGVIEASKDLGIDIEIYPHNSSIENFVKKNNLIIEEINELKIRVGDMLVLYLSHKK